MSNANRLIKNSLFLYVRMIVLMGIGFFTTRKILEALGVEDLGIYNVVGSLILMFDFVSSGLANSTQRFINVGLGKKDLELTRMYFSQSLIVHVVLALLIVLVASPLGYFIIKTKLIISAERMDAAIIVFFLSLVSLFIRLIKICFESDIIAREQMSVYAYLSIFEGLAKLIICYAIINCEKYDKLIVYGCLLLLVNVLVTLFNVLFCLIKYKESRFAFYANSSIFKELLGFVGLNSFGVIAWAIGKQGVNIVMNMFFGPAINGAKGLATQLDRVITQFGVNIDLALKPQITKLYAQGAEKEMVRLAMTSSRLIYFVMLVVSIPFLFETESILHIWLKDVPAYTGVFVRILVFETMFNIVGRPFENMSLAMGKLKSVQVTGRLITLAGLPVSYLVLKLWEEPQLPVLIMVFLTLAYTFFIVWEMNRYLHFGIVQFVKKVVVPTFFVSCVTFACCFAFAYGVSFDCYGLSLCVRGCVFVLIAVVVVSALGLSKEERLFLLSMIKKKMNVLH